MTDPLGPNQESPAMFCGKASPLLFFYLFLTGDFGLSSCEGYAGGSGDELIIHLVKSTSFLASASYKLK